MAKNKAIKKAKIEKVMSEFKAGDLHSGSKKGPKVINPKQGIAIALSEASKATDEKPPKAKKLKKIKEEKVHVGKPKAPTYKK